MVDRRYTGTKTLQSGWSVLALAVAGLALAIAPDVVTPPALVAWGGTWLLGLLALGWRERRHWTRLVERSAFERGASAGTADLHRIVEGQSVSVSTNVPGPLSRTHTVVSAGIEGVEADFTITLERVGTGGNGAGLTTGNPALDEEWVIEGGRRNVGLLLSTDVQSALMDVTVPGTATVTGELVVLRVPFTRLSEDELATCARAVAAVAARLERVGRGRTSPTG